MFVIRGRLASEAGEVLMKALKAAGEKLYAEQREDRPSAGKVRADALTLVAESALKGGLDPGSSGDRYQVVVHVNEEALKSPEAASATGCPSCASAGANSKRQRVAATSPSRKVGHRAVTAPGSETLMSLFPQKQPGASPAKAARCE